jgi:hypothetical protein
MAAISGLKIPRDALIQVMTYVDEPSVTARVNRAMHNATSVHIWQKYYLKNPFLRVFIEQIPDRILQNEEPIQCIRTIFTRVQRQMTRFHLRAPADIYLLNTAEELAFSKIENQGERANLLMFQRLVPQFQKVRRNEQFLELMKEIRTIARREDFTPENCVELIQGWLTDEENRPLLEQVGRLDLSDLNLDVLPEALARLSNLVTLNLRRNAFREEPDMDRLHHFHPLLCRLDIDYVSRIPENERTEHVFNYGELDEFTLEVSRTRRPDDRCILL